MDPSDAVALVSLAVVTGAFVFWWWTSRPLPVVHLSDPEGVRGRIFEDGDTFVVIHDDIYVVTDEGLVMVVMSA